MTDEKKRRADAVLCDVLDQPESEREAFLKRVCAGDPDLEMQVRQLLHAGLGDDGFLEPGGAQKGPVWQELAAEADPEASVRRGEEIGGYRIIRQIGRGGMGSIYLAVRKAAGVELPVALKVLRTGSGSADLLRRFEQERQILASLDHPAIARHLGGGVSEDGRPFIAMEYVDGQPINQYCDEHRLPVAERLRLFIDVARAVQHAHRSMVVHRDLKPSNILVTADRQVKLLDFGIARLIDSAPDVDGEPLTRTGLRVMTPEYASPEQVRGELVTTASDVYQLGLVLYELLSGHRPYRVRGLTAIELEQVICEQPAVAPSSALSRHGELLEKTDTGGPSLATVGRARSSRPDRLRRRLRGDLDIITMMTLRKEPERRYLSVEQLIRDLERHLDGRPISARKDTFGYRMAKFVRRHPGGLAATAMIVVLITALLGLAFERQAAEHRRVRREAAKAEQVAVFLEGLFDADERDVGAAETVSARELLDRGAERVTSDLGEQPQLQATLQNLLGDMYRKLGLYEKAEVVLSEALETRLELFGPDDEEVASSLRGLARALADVGRYSEAESHYLRALEILLAELGDKHVDVARCRIDLANLYVVEGRYDDAESTFQSAIEVLSANLDPRDPELADVIVGLSSLYWSQGRYDEVEPLLLRARSIYESSPHQDSRELATVLGNLARLASLRGEYEDAEALARRGHAMLETVLGTDHPDVAMSLNDLGRILAEQGRFEEAEPLFRDALAALERTYQGDHPDIGECLNDLALVYWDQGDLQRAEPLLERALVIGEHTLGDDHPDVGAAHNSLGALYFRQGKMNDAERSYRRALAIMEPSLGSDHPFVAAVLVNIASVLRELGRQPEAIPLCERAVAINEAALGGDHVDVARGRSVLAALHLDCASYDEAETLLGQALETFEQAFGPVHPTVVTALTRMCLVEAGRNRPGDAESFCLRALEIGDQVTGSDQVEGISAVDWRHASVMALLYLDRVDEAASVVQTLLADDSVRPYLARQWQEKTGRALP